MSHLPIWYLGKMPTEKCNTAFEEFMFINPIDASMGKNGDKVDHLFRNTTVRFADKSHWLGIDFFQYGNFANTECKWGYDIDQHEAIQFAEYGIDQKYDWHVDNFPLSGNEIDRKVTVVCMMSDPQDFEGGELQLRLYNNYVPIMEKGSIIAFPSIIEHRVTPVTKGKRYTATMWLSGPKFK